MASKHFKAVGISYRNTPLELREAVTFDEQTTKQFMSQIRDVLGIDEALILSTCNRTEVYYFSDRNLDKELASMIVSFHGAESSSAGYFKPMDHDEAVRHLFNVSLGMDSMVLGDIQITNQVKKAYQWSADESMAGPFLHRLLHTIFYTNKRVIQETPFRDGKASLASAAVEIAEHYISHYASPEIAIIGLGDIGANVAENLKGFDARITLVNRTFEKAENLASDFGYEVDRFEHIQEVVDRSHVVISAVQVPEPLINKRSVEEGAMKLFIDLSVPRSIEDSIQDIPGILLYNVDQLQEKTTEAMKRREATIPQVKAIIDDSIGEFDDWSQEMEVSPTIKKFKEALEEIRKQELARYVGKLDEKQLELMDKASKNMIQKVIKLPVLQLKAACKRGEAENLVGVLNDLFNLEKEVAKQDK